MSKFDVILALLLLSRQEVMGMPRMLQDHNQCDDSNFH